MTLKEMRDQVQRWLGLQDIASYSEAGMVNDQLYYGTIDLLSRTRCVVRCIDLHVDANVNEYMLDHSILALVDVENGQRKSRRDEKFNHSFSLIRSDILRVQPTPTEAGELQVWAVKRPAKMTTDTQSVGDEAYGAIPDEFHDAIVTYALWKLSDYTDDASGQNGERYRILYEGQDGRGGRLSQIKVAVNKRGTARAPRSKVNGLQLVRSAEAWRG